MTGGRVIAHLRCPLDLAQRLLVRDLE